MQIVARVCSHRVFKCPPFARTHAWRRFLHWSIAVSMMSCQKSDHIAINRSFSLLTIVWCVCVCVCVCVQWWQAVRLCQPQQVRGDSVTPPLECQSLASSSLFSWSSSWWWPFSLFDYPYTYGGTCYRHRHYVGTYGFCSGVRSDGYCYYD